MEMTDERVLDDLDLGNAAVFLNDGTTWGGLRGCMVRIYCDDEQWELTPEFSPKGYMRFDVEALVRHYIRTRNT